jgi:hypothetical protein
MEKKILCDLFDKADKQQTRWLTQMVIWLKKNICHFSLV